ncbi:MAG: bifunctional phosphopantothenoylcysteine decarboxylase/phosphopantothenate--cysteine ligase CoaBC [Acidimicrobiales bacterium]
MLEGRRIVLGVSGGIAAYKAIEVCRRLVDRGAHVVPVLTRGATRFVGETTFSALASERAHTSLFHDDDPIPHTRIGQSADAVVVVPATARVIGCYAAGISNDLLTATLLATVAPVVVAPAMHTEMWEHPAVQDNLATLARRGVHIVPPEEGRLAGGDVGQGRLAAPETIVAAVEAALAVDHDLAGLHVLVTAGGTREPIDPVRYVGNRSSGKQGHALAAEAAERGAKVTLVTTVGLPAPAAADVVRVETAADMEQAVQAAEASADVVLMAAAVADFRPAHVAERKLKKQAGVPEIVLEPTPDILAGLGLRKRPGQTIVGFAAETDEVRENAAVKLAAKGADLIVANDVTAPGAGFEHDTNHVVILNADGTEREVPLADKRAIARAVFDAVIQRRKTP